MGNIVHCYWSIVHRNKWFYSFPVQVSSVFSIFSQFYFLSKVAIPLSPYSLRLQIFATVLQYHQQRLYFILYSYTMAAYTS